MKINAAIFTFLFCGFFSASHAQHITKKYSLPGFIQVNDTLFISRFEISIREYARFLSVWRKRSGDPEFIRKALPSPAYLGWLDWNSFSKSAVVFGDIYEVIDKDHITNPPKDTTISYTYYLSDLPVVNVTSEQASLYCNFRNKDYQVFYASEKRKKRSEYPESLFFRLPTSKEWVLAASAGLDTAIYKYGVINDSQKNARPFSAELLQNDSIRTSIPLPVYQGQLNDLKLLNMCGNVAELVADSQFIYGGSFVDSFSACTTTSRQLFIEPKNNIGFRVVAVIRNK